MVIPAISEEGMKTLVLYSGGLDSAVCLADAIRNHGISKVTALTFRYDQSNSGEIECADALCRAWRVNHVIQRVQVAGSRDVETEVPARNTIFLAHALSMAIDRKFEAVVVGWEPNSVYADSSPAYIKGMQNIFDLYGIKLLAPVKNNENKTQTLLQALELGIPLDMVHSCLRSQVCYKCKTCLKMELAVRNIFPQLKIFPEPIEPREDSVWACIRRNVILSRGQAYDISSTMCGSFKYLPALFALSRHPIMSGANITTTGNWGAALMSVFARYPRLAPMNVNFNLTKEFFTLSEYNTDLEGARWGMYQALGHIPREACVSSRVTQGHLKEACVHLGFTWDDEKGNRLRTEEA